MRVEEFDKWAPYYDKGTLQAPLYHAMHDSVLGLVLHRRPELDRLLDLGCGTGHLLRAAALRSPATTLVGTDPCSALLQLAARAGRNVALVRAEAAHLPFPDATFDAITCTVTVRHWPDLDHGLAETARVLADDGLLAIADFFPPRRRSRWLRSSLSVPLPAYVLEGLHQAGLRLIEAREIEGYGPVSAVTVALARKYAGKAAR